MRAHPPSLLTWPAPAQLRPPSPQDSEWHRVGSTTNLIEAKKEEPKAAAAPATEAKTEEAKKEEAPVEAKKEEVKL